MQLTAIGLNHHKTPIAIRERFALSKNKLYEGLQALKKGGVRELAILSTCSRTEVYCNTHDLAPITQWLAGLGQLPESRLRPHLFIVPSRDAIRHIFRVAAGLDSMVLGESNIFGQIKEAVRMAQEQKTLGSTLHRLFQKAFAVAKEIRTQTDVGKHGVSMATVAVQLAENIFGDLSQSRIVFVGTGEMITLCATHFCARRPQATLFLSRDLTRAQSMTSRFGGEAGLMSDIEERLHEYDLVISCTDSPLPIIGAGLVQRALKKRQFRPIMMVDLGVPRNIEPEAAQNSDVFLYSVDDLQGVIESNIKSRQQAGAQAEWLIEERVDDFMRYLEGRRAVGVIQQLQKDMRQQADIEMQRSLRQMERGINAETALAEFSHRLGNQWLHPWMAQLHHVEGKPFDQTLEIYQAVLIHSQLMTSLPSPNSSKAGNGKIHESDSSDIDTLPKH